MIKGGFQGLDISGVDLTAQSPSLPGAYAACAAADGKPIRVLTADGAVQCSVKKVSTNYVLAGVTGDGKILSITVGSTDGISVNEAEIPSGSKEVDKIGTAISIPANASSSSPYTCPSDGYVYITYSNVVESGLTRLIVITEGGNVDWGKVEAHSAWAAQAWFFRKGTKIFFGYSSVNQATSRFYPIVYK